MSAPSREPDFLKEHLRCLPAFRSLVRSMECRLYRRQGPMQKPMLDMGCGDGRFAAIAFEDVFLAGVDIDVKALREANRGRRHLLLASAEGARLPFSDDQFGAVVANSVLEHVHDLDGILAEIGRVLKPGGRLFLTAPSRHFGSMLAGASLCRAVGWRAGAAAYAGWFNRRSRHRHILGPDEWMARLETRGLKTTDWRYFMSSRAMKFFDVAHYLGLPALLCRAVTGAWVPARNPATLAAAYGLMRRFHVDELSGGVGGYLFFRAEKKA